MSDDLSQLDLAAIADPALRALVARRLNLLEEARAANEALRAEVQRLTDEILRLKGEQPSRPKGPKGGGATPPAAHSSEAARTPKGPSQRGKRKRGLRRTLPVDGEQACNEPPPGLPPDAIDKGVVSVVVQQLVCRRKTVRYLRRK